MSHIVTIQTEIRDPLALQAACARLQLPRPEYGTTSLYNATATGWAVRLPRWRYPVVCDTQARRLHFDNFQGRWGDPQELDRLLQGYAIEKTTLEARRQGLSVLERNLADGSVQLTVQIGETA